MNCKKIITKNAPVILSCLGCVGVITTAILSVKATVKAIKTIEVNKKEEKIEQPTKKEIVEWCWKTYIPTASVIVGTAVCIIGSTALSKKQQVSLISAYTLLNNSYKNYREAANRVYGDDADNNIKSEIAKEMYIQSGPGEILYQPRLDGSEIITFYDDYSERYFQSTLAAVINSEYHINRQLALRGTATVNEFYSFLGLSSIDGGDLIGWSVTVLYENQMGWLDFENEFIELEDGMICYRVYTPIEPLGPDCFIEYT